MCSKRKEQHLRIAIDDLESENLGFGCSPSHLSETYLIVAVLERAIKDALGCDINNKQSQKPHIKRNAREWICSDDESPWSFLWCMEYAQMERLVDFIRDSIEDKS